MAALPGVDLDALRSWLDDDQPGLCSGELAGELIAGGKSNLTYRVTDATRTWALRRPPLGHLLPTAHDMGREFTVISALADTDVPVPRAIALCRDESVLGAPFYLMEFVDGVVLDDVDALSPAEASLCCEHLVEILTRLHGVDPAAVGLAEFGRPEGFLERQVRRWHKQWQASLTEPRENLAALVDRLTSTLPTQSPPGIVHGDYRLTNVMFARDLASIAAVVDWEMATLGDPLTDVGLLVVYQTLAAQNEFIRPHMPVSAGFLSADDMVARYAAKSSRDLADLDWYVAFGYFKLAAVAEGIHHRYLAGQTVGEGFSHFGEGVPPLLDAALVSLAAR